MPRPPATCLCPEPESPRRLDLGVTGQEGDRVSGDGVDWRRYLAEFHRERAGVIEEVLSRARSGDRSPYRWLARAVSADACTVLDLACGSGAMSRELGLPGRTVMGLDLSEHE